VGHEDEKLLQPYQAPHWAHEWFDFRRKAFFKPVSEAVTAKYLLDQFAIDLALVSCECGAFISAEMPRFVRRIPVICPACGKHHHRDRKDMTFIRVASED
jgi:hypothetical protein